ncbi:MAG: lipid II flippase MurJ [Lentisphaeria bacterium]
MEVKANKSLADRIIHASVIVGLAHICLKFAGLIQVKFATQYLDSSLYEPIMVVAFTGVINSLFLIGEEVIGPSFLTIFMREKEEKNEQAAWDYGNTVLTFQSLLLMFMVALVACFPDFFIHLFTKWDIQDNPERYKILRLSLQVLAPCLFFLSLGSTTYMLLNGYKKFFLAAFGDASTKICVVLGLVAGMGWFGWDFRALFAGLLAGSAAKLATHVLGLWKKRSLFRPSLNWRNPAFQSMLLIMLPLLAGIIFAKVRDNFNNIYVLTHLKEDGVLMANDLGRRLYSSIQWLVPYALQIALFPFLCELASRKDKEKLGEVLGSSCRLLLSVFVPGALCLSLLAMPISILIFLGGKTGIELASWAGISTACYTLVLPAAAVECVLMQGYFAEQKTVAVTVIGLIASIVSVAFSYVAIVHFQVGAVASLVVVATGFVLSRYLKSIILSIYLQKSTPMFHRKTLSLFFGKLLLLSLFTAAVTWGASELMNHLLPDGISSALAAIRGGDTFIPEVSRFKILCRLAVALSAGGIAFLGGALLLHLAEAKQMLDWAWDKVQSKIAAKKIQQ